MINIEIIYATKQSCIKKNMTFAEAISIQEAIDSSGILALGDIDLSNNRIGIYGQFVELTQLVKDGDRIEIYRPLIRDPKEIRRQRAQKK